MNTLMPILFAIALMAVLPSLSEGANAETGKIALTASQSVNKF